jgi:fructokinase
MSVVAMGELLIDFVAQQSGVTVSEAAGFEKAAGGAPANVAVAVARLGRKSAFLGQVGDDPFGHYLADVLRENGVDVSGLRFASQARTMLAFVSLRSDGERSFMFYRHPSADMLMRPEDVARNIIEQARIFHFGSITMISEPARSATLSAAEYATEQKKLISYDPNLRLALWPDADAARSGMSAGFKYAHIVKISREELEFLTGSQNLDELWQDQTQMIIVTDGANGATIHTRGGSYAHSGYQVKAVDTTGAGDAFVAGALVSLLEQYDEHGGHAPYLENVVRFANAVGALATTQRGAIPAMPTRAEVEHLMQHDT